MATGLVPITPPRVPLIDPRSGLIAREWYLFFLSLFRTADTAIDDQNFGPPVQDTGGDLAGLFEQSQLASLAARYDDLTSRVQALECAPPPGEPKRARYGQFLDTTTQTATTIDTAKAITYNTTDLSVGVRLRSPSTSEIEVDTAGVYDFQFSIQVDKTSGGTALFYIWPRVNGVDVASSASQIRIQGNDAEIFSAANFFLNLKAGDYVQFMFAVSDLSVELKTFAATAFAPAVPSIIVTVSNNIQGP